MSKTGKQRREDQQHKSFGEIETIRVDRRAVFIFDAGREIYELIDPDGRRWVMQT
jgi:uncharacterized protein with von Willebrand factor type A (vWA) domain